MSAKSGTIPKFEKSQHALVSACTWHVPVHEQEQKQNAFFVWSMGFE
jgi:hypothetical protein